MKINVACHVHSDWSYDGQVSLEAIATIFSRRGYRAVLTTEHDRGFDEARRLSHREACRAASTQDILLISGIEYSDAANCVHLLVWGNVPFIGVAQDSGSVLGSVSSDGGVAVMAHPARKEAWRMFQPTWRKGLSGIEVWNRKTDGWCPSDCAAELVHGLGLPGFVGMDFHNGRQLFPLTTVIELEEVSESSILAAIQIGKYESRALGLPLRFMCGGPVGLVLRWAEFWRRRAATAYRALPRRGAKT